MEVKKEQQNGRKLLTLIKKYKCQIKYVICGGLTTAVDFAVCFCLYGPLNHHIANVIAWCAAVIFAFFANKLWVFESRRHGITAVMAELTAFAGGRILSLIIQEGIFFAAVDIMDLNKVAVKLIASIIVVIINYVFGKLIFSYKNKNNGVRKEISDETEL